MPPLRVLLVLTLAVPLLTPLTSQADAPAETRFVVADRQARYADNESSRSLTVTAADGTPIFVEVWLPAAKGKAVPPKRVPVVVDITPYAMKGLSRPDRLNATPRWKRLFLSHGYALANVHLRGTGESGGCWGVHDRVDADDASRALEALTKAPFSDGRLALFGKSHDGGAALNVLTRGPRARLRGVKALITLSPVGSSYEFVAYGGVPDPAGVANYASINIDTTYSGRSAGTGGEPLPGDVVDHGNKDPRAPLTRTPCRADEVREELSTDGRVTPYLAEREVSLLTDRITVPTLLHYGLVEIQSGHIPGLFDRIRGPKVGLFSASGHDYPDQNSIDPRISRHDWQAMVIAWLDRWVLGARNGADRWPTVQVQDRTGHWRGEAGFPRTGGPTGSLALGPNGVLGATHPRGVTHLDQNDANYLYAHTTFTTPALRAPLHLTGQPVASTWVQLTRGDVALQAVLRVLAPDGTVLHELTAHRSTRFLDPLVHDRFVQSVPKPAPVGTPVLVPFYFYPLDVVAPAGGRVELELVPENTSPMLRPELDETVQVLHDCTHLSRLTFALPRFRPQLIDVDADDIDPRSAAERAPGLRDGGGLATRKAC